MRGFLDRLWSARAGGAGGMAADRSAPASADPRAPEKGPVPPDGPLWTLVEPDARGLPASGAGLDRIFRAGDIVVVTGWTAGDGTVDLVGADGRVLAPALHVEVPRPDVAQAHPFPTPVRGFLACWRGDGSGDAQVVAAAGPATRRAQALDRFPPARSEPDLGRILIEYRAARGGLFDLLRDSPALLRQIAWSSEPSMAAGGPQGHMDVLKTAPGAGALCTGWTLGRADFFLVDGAGACEPLTGRALRWNRPDIFRGFEADYGAGCADAGFLQALRAAPAEGGPVRLLARAGADLVLVHERAAERAPLDAVAYARWAFDLPLPPERMVERFRAHEGPLLRRLVERTRAAHRADAPAVRRVGPVPAAPEVSLVVPLFGRYDFVDHQLLEFADDPFVRQRCEVVYVVDDPNIAAPVLAAGDRWWQAYGVPLTLVWGGRNRGFSGASNLGLSLASGRHVLFLNSDVVPLAPGWLEKLSRRLDDHPGHGLLGARLLYPGGGVQHDGMVFEFNATYGVWLNQHPGKGLPPREAPAGSVVDWPAATGACLIARREEMVALGGFSEDYLIGDFEDSDLCLKAQAAGYRVGVCPDIMLTHLERQSFGLHGSGEFRMRVMLFNAWLHQERWRDAIERHAAGERMP